MYGQRIKEPLDITADMMKDLSMESDSIPVYPVEPQTHQAARIEAIDAIKLAAIYMKYQYDSNHQPKYFNVGEYVALKLHHDFKVPGLANRNTKIEQQFAGPFRILERVGKLAYRIDLPPSMARVNPVLSIAHLEPAPKPENDPFNCPFSQTIVQPLTPEKLLNKRVLGRRNGGVVVEYLVRFVGRSTERDCWINEHNLNRSFIDKYEQRLARA